MPIILIIIIQALIIITIHLTTIITIAKVIIITITAVQAMFMLRSIASIAPVVATVQNVEVTVMCLANFHRNLNPVLRVTLKDGLQKANKENVNGVMAPVKDRYNLC